MNKNNNTINLSQKNENGTDLSFSNMVGVGITKELFGVLTKDIYADSYKEDIDNVMVGLDSYMFITSLSLGDLFSDVSESKNVVSSAIFNIGSIDFNVLLQNLNSMSFTGDVYIIVVSWLKTISLEETINLEEGCYTNNLGDSYKVKIVTVNYICFFQELQVLSSCRSEEEQSNKNYLGINPIIIFQGLSWGNIVNLFKLHNITLYGGSISRRHKLSIVEYRLSVFIYLLGLFDGNKQGFYNNYVENLFSSSKYNRSNNLIEEELSKPYIYQYKTINQYFKLNFNKISLDNQIVKVEKEIKDLEVLIKSLENKIAENDRDIYIKRSYISELKSKMVDGISMKHKASLTGRIDKSNNVISDLGDSKWSYNKDINISRGKLLSKKGDYQKWLSERDNLSLVYNETKSKIKVLDKENFERSKLISKGLVKFRNIREYHTSIHNQDKLSQINKYYSTSISTKASNNSSHKFNFSIDSPIFIELQRILNNSSIDVDTQIKIEQFLLSQGKLLFKNRIDQSLDINYYKLNPSILESLKNSISELGRLIHNLKQNLLELDSKENKDNIELLLILNISDDDIISQLLGRFLRIISNNNLFNNSTNCTGLALDLGQSLLFIFFSNEYTQKIGLISKDLGLSKFVENDNVCKKVQELASDVVLIQIGLKLLNLLEEVNLIHSELHVLAENHKNYIYVVNDSILNTIGKHIKFFNVTQKIPMVVKPNTYTKNKLGGFLLNDKEYFLPLIIKNSELKEQSIIKSDNIIYDLVNHLSSVSFKINIPVLEFLLEKGLKYDLFTDPNLKHPLEIKKEEKKKLTMLEKKKLDSYLSRKQLEMNILGLALIFKNVPEFYIPVRIDNRGRVYCLVDYLNYQGIELAKALLLFGKGEKIYKCDKSSIDYLKIFGANCFGNGIDKKSYIDRVLWVDKHEEEILNFQTNDKLIKKADSKLLFIAFCFEYQKFHNSLLSNETFFISYFPIQLDATCNGYQHLSLLSGNEPLAGQLNLISGDKNTVPNDFYNFIAIKLNDYINKNWLECQKHKLLLLDKNKSNLDVNLDNHQNIEDLNKTIEKIESFERLLKLSKDRKLVKLPIMVKPYNASLFQMTNYIKEKFELFNNKDINLPDNAKFLGDNSIKKLDVKYGYIHKESPNVKLTNKDLFLLTSLIEQIVYTEFPKLKDLNSYLNEIAKICTTLNITITWTLPSGLNVKQYYVDSEAIRLKPFKFKKNSYSLKIKTNKINKAKQIRALMPNLIHSLDAASLALIVEMLHSHLDLKINQFNFFSIHDCFAVTANNVVNLIKYIKLVYIKIYSEDSYLKRFDQGIIESIKLQFGDKAFDDKTKIIKVNGHKILYPDVDQIIKGRIKAIQIMNAQSIIN